MPTEIQNGGVRGAARSAALITLPIALVAGLGVFWLLGGFPRGASGAPGSASPVPQATGPVAIPAPVLTDRAATVCRALLAQLPDRIRDRPARPVTTGSAAASSGSGSGSEQNAAYGDPPITLACGAAAPAVAPEGEVDVLSGVCWYSQRHQGAAIFTTVDREVPVAVTVPAAYAPPGQWVIEFSPAVAGSVPAASGAPSGCSP